MEPIRILTEQLRQFADQAVALTPNFLAAALVLALTYIVARFASLIARKILGRSGARPSLLRAVGTLVRLAIWIAGLLIAATIVFPNLTPTKLVAGLGIGSIAIGLAFKDTFENFLAGFLILLRKPMRIGDDIECEGLSGKVENISIRDTFLRKRSGELVIVPNSHLVQESGRDPDRPRPAPDIAGCRRGLWRGCGESAVGDREGHRLHRPCRWRHGHPRSTRGSSILPPSTSWCAGGPKAHRPMNMPRAARRSSRSRPRWDAAGIEIPFPYRTLTFAEPVPIGDGPPRAADGA